jgi:hypothetical protein
MQCRPFLSSVSVKSTMEHRTLKALLFWSILLGVSLGSVSRICAFEEVTTNWETVKEGEGRFNGGLFSRSDDSTWFVSGEEIFHYQNGTWAQESGVPSIGELLQIAVIADKGWAISRSGSLLEYRDGEWTTVPDVAPPNFSIEHHGGRPISVIDENEVWFANGYRYIDGQYEKIFQHAGFCTLIMLDGQRGIGIQNDRQFYYYSDGVWTKTDILAAPWSIDVDKNGGIWFIAPGDSKTLFHISFRSLLMGEDPQPIYQSPQFTRSVEIDEEGDVWFLQGTGVLGVTDGVIGRVDRETLETRLFSLDSPKGFISQLRLGQSTAWLVAEGLGSWSIGKGELLKPTRGHFPLEDTYDLQNNRSIMVKFPEVDNYLLFYRVNEEAFSVISGIDNDTPGLIPPFPPGWLVEYYIEMSDSEGNVVTDPSDAPLGLHSYRITDPPTGVISRGFVHVPADSVLFIERPHSLSAELLSYRQQASSATLLYQADGEGDLNEVEMVLMDGVASGEIPSFPRGTVIEYYFQSSDELGGLLAPVSAPVQRFTYVVYGPEIKISPGAVFFGIIEAAQTKIETLTVSNVGNVPLEISSIRSGNPRIRPLKTALSVAPGASEALLLAFTPLTNEIIETELILVSNDPTKESTAIPLSAMLPSPKPEPIPNSGLLIVGPTTPTIDDEVVLSISGDFPASNATIASHTYSVTGEEIMLEIATEWVGDTFDSEDSVVTSWVVDENLGRLSAGTYQLIIRVNEIGFLSSSLNVRESGAPRGLISLDFDLADGDQEQRVAGDAEAGRVYPMQINVKRGLQIAGWSLTIEFDPSQVRYSSNSFTPSDYIPGLLPLVDEQERSISVGGTVLGSTEIGTGQGALGTIAFEVLDGFSGSTDLVITENNFRFEGGGSEKYQILSIVTITEEHIEPPTQGDFDASGKVDFTDFFLFADGFGSTDSTFDLNGDGEVGFDDFFIFADNFGKEARAKLMALARDYLGLPSTPRLQQNYPNPFNSSTTIRYHIAAPAAVRLDVFDLGGQRIRTLISDFQVPGFYEVSWAGTDERGARASTGIYLLKLQSGGSVDVGKILLIK